MEKQMDNRLKIGIIITILVVAVIVATLWLLLRQPLFPSFQQRRLPPPGFVAGDFEFFYAVNTIISTVNIALLLVLVVLYVNIYVKTRSAFTVGLIIFGVVFLVKDLTSNPLVTSMYGFRAYGLGPFEFLPGLFEFVALSVLLYLSIRY